MRLLDLDTERLGRAAMDVSREGSGRCRHRRGAGRLRHGRPTSQRLSQSAQLLRARAGLNWRTRSERQQLICSRPVPSRAVPRPLAFPLLSSCPREQQARAPPAPRTPVLDDCCDHRLPIVPPGPVAWKENKRTGGIIFGSRSRSQGPRSSPTLRHAASHATQEEEKYNGKWCL